MQTNSRAVLFDYLTNKGGVAGAVEGLRATLVYPSAKSPLSGKGISSTDSD